MLTKLRKYLKKLLKNGQTARLQVSLMAISIVIISIFFVIRLNEDPVISDPYPEIEFYMPSTSGALRSRITQVSTGLSIKNFSVFDSQSNNFVVDATIWFEYDPIMVTLETISKFSFLKGKILKKSPPDIKVIGDKVFARFVIMVEFTTSLDQRFFPFEDHRIDLMLTNEHATFEELIYVARNADFTIGKNIYVSGYQFLDKQVEYGYIKSRSEDQERAIANPVVLFSMVFGKAGIRKPVLIILPLLLMFFISLFALTRSPLKERYFIPHLAMAALPAILGYRFVIESMAPKVGYSTLTDHIFSFTLSVAFGSFAIVTYYLAKGTTSISERVVRRMFIIFSYILLLIVMYYLFFYWGR